MTEPIPDLDWCIAKSAKLNLPPRCPFACPQLCPRNYQSLSLLGNAGCTRIDPNADKRLLAKWKHHFLWPQTMEYATGISSNERGPSSYHNFCPEVSYDTFNYFATFLGRYKDDIDTELAHERLSRKGAVRNDPRWNWSAITSQHYSGCPVYSVLSQGKEIRMPSAKAPPTGRKPSKRSRNLKVAPPTSAPAKQSSFKPAAFISYAHADARWLDRFLRHVKPLFADAQLDVWSDTRIRTSDNWEQEIRASLARSCAAVLFVSPDFLASDYIRNHELPVILSRAANHGLRVFSVILSPCAFTEVTFEYTDSKHGRKRIALSAYQAVNAPSKTLSEMRRPESERSLLQLAKDLIALDRALGARVNRVPSKEGARPKQRQAPATSSERKTSTSLAGSRLEPVLIHAARRAQKRAEEINCTNNLKQVALAAKIWAIDHGGVLPPDFATMKSELGTDKIIRCPHGDGSPYDMLSPGASESDSSLVYVKCAIHNIVAMVDGRVYPLGKRKVVNRPGRFVVEET